MNDIFFKVDNFCEIDIAWTLANDSKWKPLMIDIQ